MVFFKFRKSADDSSNTSAPAQSIDAIRQRAKYRLVGATLLVLAGVIGLPLLFDKQPRPIAVDTPIDIPDKNKTTPLVIPIEPTVPAPATGKGPASQIATVADKAVATAASPFPQSDIITELAAPSVTAKTVGKSSDQPAVGKGPDAAKPIAKEQSELAKTPESIAAVTKSPAAGSGRFVVQVGAFADNARAQEVRLKVEHAGLKTYTNVAETKDGRRTRVRVGPFSTKAEAEKAAKKIKKLNLPAALLTL